MASTLRYVLPRAHGAAAVSRKGEAMEGLISMVAQRTGLSEDKARAAVDTVVGYLKERAPAGLSGQIDALIGGGQESKTGGIASKAGAMFGKKEQ